MGLHKLPSYAFVGYVGLVAVLAVLFAPVFDLAPGVGWCVLAGSYLVFFLSTIEQPQVRCDWAGWVLGPGALVVAFAGVDTVNLFILLVGMGAVLTGLYLGLTENVPALAKYNWPQLKHILALVFIPPRHRQPKIRLDQLTGQPLLPTKPDKEKAA